MIRHENFPSRHVLPHNEIAWRARVHLPLRSLLGPEA